jgi:hypothetical protein
MRILELVHPGSEIWHGKNQIRDKHPETATLVAGLCRLETF